MVIKPTTYFIVSGKGESNISEKASFDAALIDAGIADYNWVPVSSILPPGIQFDEKKEMPPKGSILFCVLSVATVEKGNSITVGIGVSTTFGKSGEATPGFVMEEHAYGEEEKFVKNKIRRALRFMADNRNIILDKTKIVSLSFSPQKRFGTAVAVVVFNNYEI